MRSAGSFTHALGEIHAIPVLFLHGGNAILGGSAVGEMNLWDATTFRLHSRLLLRGMLLCCSVFPIESLSTDDDKVLAIAVSLDPRHSHNAHLRCFKAHYDITQDRFLIAGGISNPDEPAAVVVWHAEERKSALFGIVNKDSILTATVKRVVQT